VVGVAVGHIDGRQSLAGALDELCERGHVRADVLCVDQYGVGLAGHKSGCCRRERSRTPLEGQSRADEYVRL
jgi:hypothetical protein